MTLKQLYSSLIYFYFLSAPIFAQLSPGDLHRSHSELEGLKNCTRCHESGQQLAAQKCLDCHTMLQDRIKQEKGLHANPEYKKCEKCHVEHQGRNYDLIYWPNSMQAFDHTLTGYQLKGRHSSMKCRDCHQQKNISDKNVLIEQGKDPDRTFLGLVQNCLSCHQDEHRNQLKEDCLGCHTMDGWKPAAAFSHEQAKFKLSGKHITVTCQKCHPLIEDQPLPDDPVYQKFTNIRFDNCTNCHDDIHNRRFGARCSNCHTTSGWRGFAPRNFSHNQTNYPLEGKHAFLDCSKCHPPGKPLKIRKFNRCRDCHQDYHRGQFAKRSQAGACEECHTVNGFSPALFSIKQHQTTRYPLEGAHLAVPCINCHEKSGAAITFQFKSFRCQACHRDPHKNQVDAYLIKISELTGYAGCEHCHTVAGWDRIAFQHEQTGFVLNGRHSELTCRECHKATDEFHIRIKGLPSECHACHQDTHRGQFSESGGDKECQRCHSTRDWLAEKFNHNVHSRFPLEGRHVYVACVKCHKPVEEDGIKFIRYRPISWQCVACHGKNPQEN